MVVVDLLGEGGGAEPTHGEDDRQEAERYGEDEQTNHSVLPVWNINLYKRMVIWWLVGDRISFAVYFLFTVHNSSCGKEVFSKACVKNSVHMEGM